MKTITRRAGKIAMMLAAAALAPIGSIANASLYSIPSAYVWADQPTAPYGTPYVTNPLYQTTGFANQYATATHLGIGQYRVDFPELGAYPGNVQVNAYGSSAHCQAAGWGPMGSSMAVWVTCFGLDAFYADALFTVYFTSFADTQTDGRIGPHGAYLLTSSADQPDLYPSSWVSWNSNGGLNTVRRRGRGSYEVRLERFTAPGGSVLVTAFGSSGQRCKPESWRPRSTWMSVKVRCFDASGRRADSRFTLRYEPVGTVESGGFVHLTDGRSDEFVPQPNDQHNPIGDLNWVRRVGQGSYTVYFPGLGRNGGNAIVTAVGRDTAYCNVSFWGSFNSTQEVDVQCFDQSGAAKDSDFSLRIR